jgi:hypothetical protein
LAGCWTSAFLVAVLAASAVAAAALKQLQPRMAAVEGGIPYAASTWQLLLFVQAVLCAECYGFLLLLLLV